MILAPSWDAGASAIGDPSVLVTSLKVELHAPPFVAHGDTVALALTATNVTPETLTLGIPRLYSAFLVTKAGLTVWSLWGEIEWETLELRLVTLAPGETLRYDASWNSRDNHGNVVPPGTYQVRAKLRRVSLRTHPDSPPAETLTTGAKTLTITR